MSDERCRHGMRPEWCADCREQESEEMSCGTYAAAITGTDTKARDRLVKALRGEES